jgi:hypothetical protein
VGPTGATGSDRGAMRARANAAGVTAQQARRLPRAARPRSRGPAPLRPTCHQAQRLARRSSRSEQTQHSGGPAPGMAGGRGDDLARAQPTKRSATQWSAAPCASSGPVRQAGERNRWRSRTRDGHQRACGPRPREGAALVITAGAAGQSVFARRMEARQGRDAQRLDAKHDSLAPRSGDAPDDQRARAMTTRSIAACAPTTTTLPHATACSSTSASGERTPSGHRRRYSRW